jgi:putative transcriptional regulator
MIKVKIIEILEERNQSIYWLAKESDLSYPTVFNLCKNDTKSIQFETLEKIMTALEISDFNKILEIT